MTTPPMRRGTLGKSISDDYEEARWTTMLNDGNNGITSIDEKEEKKSER